jgi:thiamine-monophosphate kinase
VLRRGARPGDAVCVTGRLGYSLGGKHLDFMPRVREAAGLHACCELHAMIDLSDGLARDAFHLARASACRIVLEADEIPISRGEPADERAPLDHALNDGEDFELLFTLSAEEAARLIADPPFDEPPVTRIGECVEGEGVFLRSRVGEVRPLTPGGFEHAW